MSLAILGKNDPKPFPEGSTGPPAPASGGATVLAPGVRFVGELTGGEDVVVNGRFEGTLRVERRVTVGPRGDVDGEIRAREVIVFGRVKGDVLASERAELTESAAVEGKVQAPKIVIAEGAKLQGNVAMSPETASAPGGPPATGKRV
jgi:cytoskeletal protein CcmA (bactofilin family)